MAAINALVPVKRAVAGKARLSRLLSPAERAALVRAMLRDVVGALVEAGLVRRVAVTSPDAEMLALARELGALPLAEPPETRGLNAALGHAIRRLAADGADAVLVVQGDVPEIGGADVATLVAGLPAGRLVRAAPSADGGTSALLLSPPDVVAPAFGPDSFARHRAAALAAGVAFGQCDLPALAWDVDRPEDVERLLRSARAVHTRAALLRAGVPGRLSRAP